MSTPAENRKLWVDALRSEEFEQGKDRLCREDQFCPLGVACEIYRRQTGLGEWITDPNWKADSEFLGECDYPPGPSFLGHETCLPREVKHWLGLRSSHGAFNKDAGSLTFLNDSLDKSFSEIADVIEDEPEGLLA